MSTGIFTYDGWGQQFRFRNFETVDNISYFTDLLMDFKQNIVYEINNANQTCKKKTLVTSFNPIQVPPDSVFAGQAIMGTTSIPEGGVLVNNWVGEVPEIQVKYMFIFSEYTCLPVTVMIHTPEFNWSAISFFNQVLTVVDPSDFIPPAFCENAVPEETDKTDFVRALASVRNL
ncbi:hypothetical protein NFI96_011142 [Prochilodus magdalenae]|nr:hypothetical protein NFI96_011142 [Prochilodus magdalenae]